MALVKDPITGLLKRVPDPVKNTGLAPSSVEAQQQPEPQNNAGQFKRGLRQGVASVQSLGQGAFAAAAGLVGEDEIAERNAQEAQERTQRAQQANPLRIERVEDVNSVDDALDFIAGTFGRQAPILGTTLAGGAGSQLIKRGATSALAGAFAPSAAMQTGELFPEALAERTDDTSIQDVALASVGTGLAGGALDIASPIMALRRLGVGGGVSKRLTGNFVQRALKEGGKQVAVEGATEGAQTLMQRGTRNFLNENVDILGEEGYSELLNSVVAGGLVGGGLGGVTGALSRGAPLSEEERVAEEMGESEDIQATRNQIRKQRMADIDPEAVEDIPEDGILSEEEESSLLNAEVRASFTNPELIRTSNDSIKTLARVAAADAAEVKELARIAAGKRGLQSADTPPSQIEQTPEVSDEDVTMLRALASGEVDRISDDPVFKQVIVDRLSEKFDNVNQLVADIDQVINTDRSGGFTSEFEQGVEADELSADFGEDTTAADFQSNPSTRISVSDETIGFELNNGVGFVEGSEAAAARLENLGDDRARSLERMGVAVQERATEMFGTENTAEKAEFIEKSAVRQYNSISKAQRGETTLENVKDDPKAFLDKFQAVRVQRQPTAVRVDAQEVSLTQEDLFGSEDSFATARLQDAKQELKGVKQALAGIEEQALAETIDEVMGPAGDRFGELTSIEARSIESQARKKAVAIRNNSEAAFEARRLEKLIKKAENKKTENSVFRKKNKVASPYFFRVKDEKGVVRDVATFNLVKAAARKLGIQLNSKENLALALASGRGMLLAQGVEFVGEGKHALNADSIVYSRDKVETTVRDLMEHASTKGAPDINEETFGFAEERGLPRRKQGEEFDAYLKRAGTTRKRLKQATSKSAVAKQALEKLMGAGGTFSEVTKAIRKDPELQAALETIEADQSFKRGYQPDTIRQRGPWEAQQGRGFKGASAREVRRILREQDIENEIAFWDDTRFLTEGEPKPQKLERLPNEELDDYLNRVAAKVKDIGSALPGEETFGFESTEEAPVRKEGETLEDFLVGTGAETTESIAEEDSAAIEALEGKKKADAIKELVKLRKEEAKKEVQFHTEKDHVHADVKKSINFTDKTDPLLSETNPTHVKLVKQWAKEFGLKAPKVVSRVEMQQILDRIHGSSTNLSRVGGLILTDTEGNSFIYINRTLSDAAQVEVLAHEFGHSIYKQAQTDARADNDLFMQMREAHEQWLKDVKGLTVKQLMKRRAGFASLLDHGDVLSDTSAESSPQAEWLHDFEEWFADNVARSLTTKPSNKVEEFFAEIGKKIQKLFERARKAGYTANPTVEQFLDSLRVDNQQVEIDEHSAEYGGEFLRQMIDEDPFSAASHKALKKLISRLPKEQKRLLAQAFWSSTPVRRRLKALLGEDLAAEIDLENNVTATIAYGYQFWAAGQLNIGPQTFGVFGSLRDSIVGLSGIIPEDDQALQVANAIRSGLIHVRHSGPDTSFVVKKRIRDTVLQRATQEVMKVYNWTAPWREKIWHTADGRMIDMNNPMAQLLVERLHARVGLEGVSETYTEAKQTNIGKFTNSFQQIVRRHIEDVPGADKARVLEFLQSRDTGMIEGFTAADLEAARQINNYFKGLFKYAEKNGLLDKKSQRKNYFPRVYDMQEMIDRGDEFMAVLLKPENAPGMQKIADGMTKNARKQWAKAQRAALKNARRKIENELSDDPSIPPAVRKEMQAEVMDLSRQIKEADAAAERAVPTVELQVAAETIYSNIVSEMGYEDTSLDARADGHVPFARSINTRALGFVAEADLASFQSKDMDQTVRVYVEQLVKRAEMKKRFGEGEISDIITRAKEEFGATDAEIDTMHKYVNAIQGTIGIDTNVLLTKVFTGKAPPKGQVINPELQKTISAAIVFQNLRTLGMATFTSLADPVGIIVRSGELSSAWTAFKVGFDNIRFEATGDQSKRTELRQMAEALGIVDTYMTNEALGWEYGGIYMGGTTRKINETFFKSIGLTGLTRLTRLMALATGRKFLKTHADGTATAHSQRFLAELGLKPGDVIIDADGQAEILTEAQRETASPDRLVKDDKVRVALNRFVNQSILRPNASQRPIWASDPHFAIIFHLKSFMYSFHDTILRRVYREATLKNYAPLAHLLIFIPAMIAIDWLRDLIKFGGEENPRKKDWDFWDHAYEATQRSGLTGLGQIYLDAGTDIEYGGIGVESFLGPSFDTATKIDDVFKNDSEENYELFIDQLPANSIYGEYLSFDDEIPSR